MRNYRDKPIVFELRLQYGGDVEFSGGRPTSSFDYRTIETRLTAGPRGNSAYPFAATVHHRANAKQDRVRLKRLDPPS